MRFPDQSALRMRSILQRNFDDGASHRVISRCDAATDCIEQQQLRLMYRLRVDVGYGTRKDQPRQRTNGFNAGCVRIG